MSDGKELNWELDMIWALVPVLPLISCVTLGSSLNLSEARSSVSSESKDSPLAAPQDYEMAQ